MEQIRSFVGALYIGGMTRGVFVTTSGFQAGCQAAARLAELRGTPVELVDAERFLTALGISQRSRKECSQYPELAVETLPIIEERTKSLPKL